MRKQYAIYNDFGGLHSVYTSEKEAERWAKEIPNSFVMIFHYLTPLQIKTISYVQAIDFENRMRFAIHNTKKYSTE